jgi:glycosyltransferase involved in cell wall biosynthesis
MPCLNEAETFRNLHPQAFDFLNRHGIRGEVVVGDNGSTDGSQEIARRLGARVVNVPTRGYGAALYGRNTWQPVGRYVIMGDSDDSYDFSNLMPFLEKLRAGYDLVMGNRFRGGIQPGAMPWKNRYIGNPILTGIGRLLFRCPAGDFHCGLRGYSLEAFKRMDLRTTGMEFAQKWSSRPRFWGCGLPKCRLRFHPTVGLVHRIFARGGMAGGICASCCCTAHAGFFSIRDCS